MPAPEQSGAVRLLDSSDDETFDLGIGESEELTVSDVGLLLAKLDTLNGAVVALGDKVDQLGNAHKMDIRVTKIETRSQLINLILGAIGLGMLTIVLALLFGGG